MRKISWLLAIIVLFGSNLHAQTTDKWTLEECIQYAIAHNIDIKQLSVQKETSENQVNTDQMSRLPDLNANVGQNWNFGRTQTASGLYENQTQSNSSVSIGSSIPLFTGFRINNQIARSKLELEAAIQNLEKAKEDLALNVASLFLQVLFNKEILKVNEERLTLSQSQVKKTEVLIEVGKAPVSQLYDIQAQVAADEVAVVQAKNNLQLALLDLAQRLELERTVAFDIQEPDTEKLMQDNAQNILSPDLIYENAITFKPVIKAQEYNLKSAEKSLKITQAGYMPTLNLDLGYSTRYYYNYDMKGVINPSTNEPVNRPFSDQFRDNAGEYIGLSLNIPIFNRFSVRNQVRTAKLNIENQQLSLENTKKALYKEIQTAYLNATAAQEKYQASSRAVIASQEAFKYAEERYQIGKSTVFEFNDAKTKLIQSLSEQIQEKYNYIFCTKILDFYNGMSIKL